MKEKLASIEFLRIFGALNIVLYHIGLYSSSGLSFLCALPLFFCISAYLMMMTTEKGVKKHFIVKRLIRLLPLYWLLTVATFFAAKVLPELNHEGDLGIVELIKSMLLIPYTRFSSSGSAIVSPIVGPGWTLFYDVSFVIIFFIASKISHKYRGWIAIGICAILMILKAFLPTENPFVAVYASTRWIAFIAGILIYMIIKAYNEHKPSEKVQKIIKIASGIIAAASFIVIYFISMEFELQTIFAFGLLFGLLILFENVKAPKALSSIGNVTYSLYLVNYYVAFLAAKIFDFSTITVKSVIGSIITLAAAYLVAWCAYQIIEKRFGGWLTKVLKLDAKKDTSGTK